MNPVIEFILGGLASVAVSLFAYHLGRRDGKLATGRKVVEAFEAIKRGKEAELIVEQPGSTVRIVFSGRENTDEGGAK